MVWTLLRVFIRYLNSLHALKWERVGCLKKGKTMFSPLGLLMMFILGYLIGRLITELQTERKRNKLNKQVMNYYKDLGIYKD